MIKNIRYILFCFCFFSCSEENEDEKAYEEKNIVVKGVLERSGRKMYAFKMLSESGELFYIKDSVWVDDGLPESLRKKGSLGGNEVGHLVGKAVVLKCDILVKEGSVSMIIDIEKGEILK